MTDTQPSAMRPQPAAAETRHRRSLYVRLGLAGLIAVFVVVFIAQNRFRAPLHFLWMDFRAPLWLLLLICTALGLLIGVVLVLRTRRRD